ncbi:helix-turn-helix domain-containing protein [Pseudoduganella sp. RAF53_2]|uniref:helix-turn-helix domain-containing protein n=1 Tax=unclassified Pseudoduganella TaxID=2637179 RepID=UPI003F9CEED6
MRALRRVVEPGSFTAASDAMDISHTIASRQQSSIPAYRHPVHQRSAGRRGIATAQVYAQRDWA